MLNKLRKHLTKHITCIARVIVYTGITPNQLTLTALPLSFLSLYFASKSDIILFTSLTLVIGLIDLVDGVLARLTQRVTKFGALLDSTVDRIVDSVLILGLYFILSLNVYEVFTLIVVSLLISYVRARAESLGLSMEGVGLIERPERILLIIAILTISMYSKNYAYLLFYVLLVLSGATVLQRIIYAYRHFR